MGNETEACLVKNKFELVADYKPLGDQPKAIEALVKKINAGQRHQTLLGATGTGKTFTISNVVAEINRPTLVMAHNKTLAGQLNSEFKEYFPNNAVEYLDRKSTRLNSSHVASSYAGFCLKKKIGYAEYRRTR